MEGHSLAAGPFRISFTADRIREKREKRMNTSTKSKVIVPALCHKGKHLLDNENGVYFPGAIRVTCKTCERFYLDRNEDLFWQIKERNLRRGDSDLLWQARCQRFLDILK